MAKRHPNLRSLKSVFTIKHVFRVGDLARSHQELNVSSAVRFSKLILVLYPFNNASR